MKTLSVEFTHPQRCGFFSSLIKLIQRTPYSHVRLSWINSTGVKVVYEASGSSVRFFGPLAMTDRPTVVVDSFTFDLDKEGYRQLIKTCMTYAGIEYSFGQVINIGLSNLGFRWKPFSQDNEYAQVCSELVTRVLQDLGINLKLDPDMAGPREIHNALKELR